MKKEKKGISYQFKLIEMKMVKARIPLEDMRALVFPIIPYQVITGNYDFSQSVVSKKIYITLEFRKTVLFNRVIKQQYDREQV